MTELERIAKLVVDERISRGWSQKELAATARIGDSTLARIEQARPPKATDRIMQKIAIAFGRFYDRANIQFIGGPQMPGQSPIRMVFKKEDGTEDDFPQVFVDRFHAAARERNVDPVILFIELSRQVGWLKPGQEAKINFHTHDDMIAEARAKLSRGEALDAEERELIEEAGGEATTSQGSTPTPTSTQAATGDGGKPATGVTGKRQARPRARARQPHRK